MSGLSARQQGKDRDMREKNPEWVTKITQYIIARMSEGKTWEESMTELGERAGIENFNPANPTESELQEIARHI